MTKGGDTDWDVALRAVLRYVDVRGPRSISRSARSAGVDIGRWAEAQREAYWSGALTPSQAARLEAVPLWSWDGPSQRRWQSTLDALRRHAAHTSPVAIPGNAWAGKVRIGRWVQAQRSAYRRGSLPDDLVRALESVPGWVWADGDDERWQLGWVALQAWVGRHGTADVAVDEVPDGFPLGAWVRRAREDHRAGTLDAGRAAALDGLPGWQWTVSAARWQEGLLALEMYAGRTGHSRPPQNTVVDGFALGMWVHNRRREYRAGTLAADRAQVLEGLPGWSWSPQADASRR